MAQWVFAYGNQGGRFVWIDRDGPDEREQWRAARRFIQRRGSAMVVAYLDDGKSRNAGVLLAAELLAMTLGDFWDWLDGWLEEHAYPGAEVIAASVQT